MHAQAPSLTAELHAYPKEKVRTVYKPKFHNETFIYLGLRTVKRFCTVNVRTPHVVREPG
jgi:hypothetical protein